MARADLTFISIFNLLCATTLFLQTSWVSGVAAMFVLNLIRIVAFFLVAKYLQSSGVEFAVAAQSMFHSSVGTVFYTIGIALFFRVAYLVPVKSVTR